MEFSRTTFDPPIVKREGTTVQWETRLGSEGVFISIVKATHADGTVTEHIATTTVRRDA